VTRASEASTSFAIRMEQAFASPDALVAIGDGGGGGGGGGGGHDSSAVILVVQRSAMKRDNVDAQATRFLGLVSTLMLPLKVASAIKVSKRAAHPIAVIIIVNVITIISSNVINTMHIICCMPTCADQRLIAWSQLLTASAPCSRCESG
jgi:hypothetical protein